jgi:hypothetical protein
MTQYALPLIDPDVTTGTDLAQYLNAWAPALLSQHAGPDRPTYAVDGMLWVHQVNASEWNLMLFSGGADTRIGTVNPTTHEFSILVDGQPPATTEDVIALTIALG